MPQTYILMMDVDDEFGVLTRITGRIRREGLNISALSVAQTGIPGISRMTVRVQMQGSPIEQMINRLSRLDCVKKIQLCEENTLPIRELALVCCGTSSPLPNGETILYQTENRIYFEKTGTPQELDCYLKEHQSQILEFSRSGAVTIGGKNHE